MRRLLPLILLACSSANEPLEGDSFAEHDSAPPDAEADTDGDADADSDTDADADADADPDADTDADADSDLPTLDLSEVTWLHTDVSGWSVAADLASVSFEGSDICLNYDKADEWPVVNAASAGNVDVVGNPWVFIWHEERWYGATWEWLRPGQTCKAQSSVAGDHIKQAPFDEASGWVPDSGQTLWFMVSGLARSSERNVEERTQPVQVIWP